jgi:calcineurin-like phosphoesterase family protein
MATFFTADHHFGHENIIKFEERKPLYQGGRLFNSAGEMDEYLIGQWNEVVGKEDTVYCLGDFSFNQTTMQKVVRRLNGRKILIAGNHDPFFTRLTMEGKTKLPAEARKDAYAVGFSEVHLELDIEIEGVGLVRMSHFPYFPRCPAMEEKYNLRHAENRPANEQEKMLIHGHIHSQWKVLVTPDFPPQLNVGVDMWNMKPVAEEVVVAQYKKHSQSQRKT